MDLVKIQIPGKEKNPLHLFLPLAKVFYSRLVDGNIESMYGKWKHWGDEYVTNVMYAHQSFHQNALSVPCLTIKNISPEW